MYTLLKKSVEMAIQLGLKDMVVTLDQGTYSKALEVLWKKELSSCVLVWLGSLTLIFLLKISLYGDCSMVLWGMAL